MESDDFDVVTIDVSFDITGGVTKLCNKVMLPIS